MESDELGNDMVRIDGGFLVDEETYVVNSDDVLDEENNSDSGGKNAPLREQDRFLPIANIAKIMKRAIPDNGKIAKDARECVQECISEFISFVTSEASDRCQVEKRKTINGEDVLFAMNALGFDNYVEPLKIYLKKYREIVLSPITINKLSKTIIIYGGDEENNSDSGGKNAPLREQDRFLPIANIAKIMKRAIPDNGKIAKDARECVQECISEFISFVTSEASDRCQVEKRKTINGEDVLFAMNALGFDNYVEPLKIYLKKYREIVLSPITINKLSKTIIIYGGEDGVESTCLAETVNDPQSDSAVLYAYPKGAIDEYNIS